MFEQRRFHNKCVSQGGLASFSPIQLLLDSARRDNVLQAISGFLCRISVLFSGIFQVRYLPRNHFVFILCVSLFKYPLHASCKVDWQFRESCQSVRARLVGQMEAWQVRDFEGGK